MSLTGSLYVSVSPESPYIVDVDPDVVEIIGDGFGVFSPSAISSSYSLTSSYALNADSDNLISASFGPFRQTGSFWSTNQDLQLSGSTEVVYLDFFPDGEPEYEEGRVWYSNIDRSLELMTDVQEVSLQIGQEQYIRVRNNTGITITNGQVVKITGAAGNRPSIGLAIAQEHPLEPESENEVIGFATHDIPNNTDGFVTVQGLVNFVDTSDYTEGNLLWLSDTISGSFTGSLPTAPADVISLGVVVRSNAESGSIYVHPNPPTHFRDISGLSGSTNPEDRSLWVYESSSRVWINTRDGMQLTGSFSGSFVGDGSGLTGISGGGGSGGPWYETGSYWSATEPEPILTTGSHTITEDILVNSVTVGTGSGDGTNSTVFGFEALQNNNFGIWNTSVGYRTLQNNDDGYYMTAVGHRALISLTNGFWEGNTALGFENLLNLRGGSGNTGVGSQALGNLRNGNSNSVVGEFALIAVRQGGGNSALGGQAGLNLISGSGNVLIGYRAGLNLDDPLADVDNNTIIGYQTGYGIVSGSANTILGANVTGLSAGLRDTIIIANGSGSIGVYVDDTQTVIMSQSVSENRLEIPSVTTNPTGSTPSLSGSSTAALVYNETDNFLYVFAGGTWRSSSFA